jgi:hypothetical protein
VISCTRHWYRDTYTDNPCLATVDVVAKAGVSLPISNAEIRHTHTRIELRKTLLATFFELRYQQALQNTTRNQIICCQLSAT